MSTTYNNEHPLGQSFVCPVVDETTEEAQKRIASLWDVLGEADPPKTEDGYLVYPFQCPEPDTSSVPEDAPFVDIHAAIPHSRAENDSAYTSVRAAPLVECVRQTRYFRNVSSFSHLGGLANLPRNMEFIHWTDAVRLPVEMPEDVYDMHGDPIYNRFESPFYIYLHKEVFEDVILKFGTNPCEGSFDYDTPVLKVRYQEHDDLGVDIVKRLGKLAHNLQDSSRELGADVLVGAHTTSRTAETILDCLAVGDNEGSLYYSRADCITVQPTSPRGDVYTSLSSVACRGSGNVRSALTAIDKYISRSVTGCDYEGPHIYVSLPFVVVDTVVNGDGYHEVVEDEEGRHQYSLHLPEYVSGTHAFNRMLREYKPWKDRVINADAVTRVIDNPATSIESRRWILKSEAFATSSDYEYTEYYDGMVKVTEGKVDGHTKVRMSSGGDPVWLPDTNVRVCPVLGHTFYEGLGHTLRLTIRGTLDDYLLSPEAYNVKEAGVVRDYHSRTRPRFTRYDQEGPWDSHVNSYGYTVGFEVEKNEVDGATGRGDFIEPTKLFNNWEYDGSCGYRGGCGVEGISNVYDLHNQRELLVEHVKEAKDHLAAPSNHYCGGHIHVIGEGLTITKVKPFAGLLYAIYRERLRWHYCSSNKKLDNSGVSYPVIRQRGVNHLEFRLFRRVVNGDVLLRRYDLLGLIMTGVENKWTLEGLIRKAKTVLSEMYPNETKRKEMLRFARLFDEWICNNDPDFTPHCDIRPFVEGHDLNFSDLDEITDSDSALG